MRRTALFVATAFVLSACQNGSGEPRIEKGTGTGAGVGAVLGGVIGAIVDKNDVRGVAVGGALGAAAGAAVGSIFDRQQKDLENQLEQERADNQVQIERVRDDLLRINLSNEVSFEVNSATLNPAFEPSLAKLADVLEKYSETEATIIGYTDSTGTEEYNLQLSQQRAYAVRDALEQDGVSAWRLQAEGRGEAEPRADNSTARGRELNRRVEILVRPTDNTQSTSPAPAAAPASSDSNW
ncbi:MAG: OmpA family protein [Geminicoccaceae bacterium]|nr:OmpA family protein [Geminicoccaceae bacterium]